MPITVKARFQKDILVPILAESGLAILQETGGLILVEPSFESQTTNMPLANFEPAATVTGNFKSSITIKGRFQ